MAHIVTGIVAHVDAGKTTLSEALLYTAGMLRKPGRVDDGDAFLDTDTLEKKRGITIFPHEAVLRTGDDTVTLLDTPGHADFAASTESVLSVLDVAVLVVSASDGVQGSTRVLWRLLDRLGVPVIVFVNKCDALGADPAGVLSDMREGLSDSVMPFMPVPAAGGASAAGEAGDETHHPVCLIPTDTLEQMAASDDDLLASYLESGTLAQQQIRSCVTRRLAVPVYFGSALRLEGISPLLDALTRWTAPRVPATAGDGPFSARVFRISHEGGERLTWLRVLSGTLVAKQPVIVQGGDEEKADQIRLYDGARFGTVRQVGAGGVATITGPLSTHAGQGLGGAVSAVPALRPAFRSSIEAPGADPRKLEATVRALADEEPLLDPRWQGTGEQARLVVSIMGELQEQILVSELAARFGISAGFGTPQVLYTETISRPVEGVGHFEPLRHYAEVHVRLDPAPRGTGITVRSKLSTDVLAASWQHQILSRLSTHTLVGVLTGSPLTDVTITLVAARASNVHTVGGDFRQAADRAVRQGLMQLRGNSGDDDDASSGTSRGVVLLEPWQALRLELPEEYVGRAMNDLQRLGAQVRLGRAPAGRAVLEGSAPAAGLRGYGRQVGIYTHGEASLELTADGSRPVADPKDIISRIGYDPVADLDNPPGSVFCAHGAGYPVAWDRVPEIMHLPWAETDLHHEG